MDNVQFLSRSFESHFHPNKLRSLQNLTIKESASHPFFKLVLLLFVHILLASPPHPPISPALVNWTYNTVIPRAFAHYLFLLLAIPFPNHYGFHIIGISFLSNF